MNATVRADIQDFADRFPLKEYLRDSTFLITGVTGLIGTAMIRCLSALNVNIRIIAPVRNLQKAYELFGSYTNVELYEGNLLNFEYNHFSNIDYIIHGASPTASKFFVEKPVETINSIVQPTQQLLNYALNSNIKSFVFLSSLEVYGQQINDENALAEPDTGRLDIADVRSSYPLAKQLCENLCCAYAKEYHVPAKIARLTQTSGAGIAPDDNRVMAQFVRCASDSEDIVMFTEGLSARPYCYITDAVSAILYILLKGEDRSAYNVANEDTYISAKDLAYIVKNTLNPNIQVKFELNRNMGYAPVSYLKLSAQKLRALGWRPQYNLQQMLERIFEYLNK